VLGVKIWRRLLGVDDRTVIERIEFDEEADAVVAHVRPRRLGKRPAAGVASGRRATTREKGVGDGDRSTSARSARSWRRRHPGWTAPSTGRR
jgi:hypothetical protein